MTHNESRLDKPLHKLIKEGITLNEEEIKATNIKLKKVLIEKMEDEMKRDETFNRIYKQPHYVGSYYENLRVGAPTEFDINLELQLPIPDSEIQIETKGATAGFARMKVGTTFSPNTTEAVRRKIENWLDNGYVNKDKVFRWLQGVVDKALRNIQWDPDMRVQRSTSGPAVTLNICNENMKFDVDFVPVFMFEENRWPSPPLRQLNQFPRTGATSWPISGMGRNSGFPNQFRSSPQSHHKPVVHEQPVRCRGERATQTLKWCVVPKTPRGKNSSTEWRMSFYMHEKEIMNGQDNMKPVIKLFKLLRDKQNWSGLSSYYIKTIFLLEMDGQHSWRTGLGSLFMHMLERLQDYLEKEKIPFYWDQRCNLIDHLNKSQISNMCGRVKRVIKTLRNALASNEDLNTVIFKIFTHNSNIEQQPSCPNFTATTSGCTTTREEQQPQEQSSWLGVALIGGIVVGLGALTIGLLSSGNRKSKS